MVPLSICIAAILICSGLALCIGLCIATAHRAIDEDFRPQVMAYAKLVRDYEQPRLLPMNDETRARLRLQQLSRTVH